MLLINGEEVRNGDVHLVLAPDELGLLGHVGILDALVLLVKLYAVVDRVGDLREGLLVGGEVELFLLDLDLVGHDEVARGGLHRTLDDGNDESLDRVLLAVLDARLDMRALVNLIALELLVADSLVVVDRPVVAQEQHTVGQRDQNEAGHRKQVLLVCQLPAELVKEN